MFLGQEMHYYMVCIAYYTELNLQICNYAQKRRICRDNSKYALDENFHGNFCPRRKAANFCHYYYISDTSIAEDDKDNRLVQLQTKYDNCPPFLFMHG